MWPLMTKPLNDMHSNRFTKCSPIENNLHINGFGLYRFVLSRSWITGSRFLFGVRSRVGRSCRFLSRSVVLGVRRGSGQGDQSGDDEQLFELKH